MYTDFDNCLKLHSLGVFCVHYSSFVIGDLGIMSLYFDLTVLALKPVKLKFEKYDLDYVYSYFPICLNKDLIYQLKSLSIHFIFSDMCLLIFYQDYDFNLSLQILGKVDLTLVYVSERNVCLQESYMCSYRLRYIKHVDRQYIWKTLTY